MLVSQKQNIAIAIAFLFHLCGAVGILFSPYANWFINNTSFNLLLMFVLICYTQIAIEKEYYKRSGIKQFAQFTIIAFTIGFFAEVIGVNTGLLFGNYSYGNLMGVKFFNVPLLIGLQWFVTIYCCGTIVSFISKWALKKLKDLGEEEKAQTKTFSLSTIMDAALLATFFDYLLEPAAQKLGYWQWSNNEIPIYNYTCWFIISFVIMLVFSQFKFNKLNKFAIHLFIIQTLFFLAINKLKI